MCVKSELGPHLVHICLVLESTRQTARFVVRVRSPRVTAGPLELRFHHVPRPALDVFLGFVALEASLPPREQKTCSVSRHEADTPR